MNRSILFSLLFYCACPPTLAASLVDAQPGETVVIHGLQLGDSKALAGDITLERIDIYAPGARILRPNGNGGYDQLPRNPERYFIRADGNLSDAFYIAVSPDGKHFRGTLFGFGGNRQFSGIVDGSTLHVEKSASLKAQGVDYQCDVSGDRFQWAVAPKRPLRHAGTVAKTTAGTLHQAVVAIDTDNELMDLKFGDNISSATSYLADLFAGMNVMYERDLDVRLVQGDTFLRISSVADPYSQTTTNNQLNEVGGYWMNNNAGIERAFVAFLSGKSPQPNSGGGIAWVLKSGNYCNATGFDQGGGQISGHFSATQIVRSTGADFNVGLVGHELGHNFGASHTHCTDITTGASDVATNTIDQCHSGESGCYGGATSCPNDSSMMNPTQGSVMSYCHACGIQDQFHPTHQVVLGARVTSNITNGCLAAVGGGGGNGIFANGFE